MADGGPRILVVAGDGEERAGLIAALRGAGFRPVAAGDEVAAVREHASRRFAAIIIALPGERGSALLRAARRYQPGVPALMVLEPEARPLDGLDCIALYERAVDPRQVLDGIFELVLREPATSHGTPDAAAAEHGIAVAQLACFYRRLAAADSFSQARDLSRQIGALAIPNPVGAPLGGGA